MHQVLRAALALSAACWLLTNSADAQSAPPSPRLEWLTVASNLDGGFRTTEFFEVDHDAAVVQWDTRLELWLPPSRDTFSWGPYIRVAGIKSSRAEAWENALLGGPGVGFQVFPFSAARWRVPDSRTGYIGGPLRIFAEYNFVTFWGDHNRWRPDRQTRVGLDYWRALHTNDLMQWWWLETWNGLQWQSSNDVFADYNTWTLGNAVRAGVRKQDSGVVSTLTPYVAFESSRNKRNESYWENRLLAGGGMRVSPSLGIPGGPPRTWLTRLIFYGEILHTAAYYGAIAPVYVPRTDVRLGASVSLGEWYR